MAETKRHMDTGIEGGGVKMLSFIMKDKGCESGFF